ncbi:transposase [Aquamicrobium lusatiense]|uniref:transposase n=1 Tax=Aquamicrobium lusatiense TaxID=89772 RepID=UPI002456B4A9|nr:transposase [Aquamicrobium lusatiense]MDH4989352.1 transposase [Aquamicrobium lusatiense]
MKAAIGDVSRFDEPQKLVSYLGLNRIVRQSGPGPVPWADRQTGPRSCRATCSSRRHGLPLVLPNRCGLSSYVCERAAARRGPHMPTPSKAIGTKSADGWSRPRVLCPLRRRLEQARS